MGQEDVLKVLEKEKDWLIKRAINERVESNTASVGMSLRLLVRYKSIIRRKIKTKHGFIYEYKI